MGQKSSIIAAEGSSGWVLAKSQPNSDNKMVAEFGYAGKILRVDLSSGSKTNVPTAAYADRFLGGRGIAAKIYWDEVPPSVGPFDPENRLIFVTGPLAGLPGLAGSRWQVCGKSPTAVPEHFSYSNLGGGWGAYLKFAGYDGIVVQGKSEKPVYLFLHDGIAEIRDASHLWGKGSIETREILKSELGQATRVVSTGLAGDNMVVFASVLADNDSSGSSGLGAVMGSKKLKAIAVAGREKVAVANPERLRELTRYVRELKGTATEEPEESPANARKKKELCYGCIAGCIRGAYQPDNGKPGKFMCQSSAFYEAWARRYYGEWNDVSFRATKLCDDYGLDTKALTPMLAWLSRCGKAGILTDENTGIPISKLGGLEFIETLLKKLSLREDFGDVLARGTLRAAELVGHGAAEQIADYSLKAGQGVTYGPQMFTTTGLLYMIEPRQPIQELHEISNLVVHWLKWVNKKQGAYVSSDVLRTIAKRFWGSEVAADFSTYEGKAVAAKRIQDRQYAKESLILCDFSWPITRVEHADHVGDPTIESQVVSAVTGRELDEYGLYRLGERVLNLQRAILIREGDKGRSSDTIPEPCYTTPLETDSRNPQCLVPGKEGEVISRKGAVVDRGKFEKLKDEYYQLRGWDTISGLQTIETLKELGLQDIATDLERRGLVTGRSA